MRNLRYYSLFLILFLLGQTALGQSGQFSLDSNTAFYEGENLNYVIYAPRDFRMVTDEAKIDGYSFAFVPDSQEYKMATTTIGVNIYKIRGIKFKSILKRDTLSIRKHYGKKLSLYSVDSVFNGTGDELVTLYIDDESRFLPNVMISYFNGGNEVVIFELVISEGAIRPESEDVFIDCINRFKALKRGTLGMR